MDINRIIDIIRTLKEEGIGVGAVSAGPTNKTGPGVATFDPVMSFKTEPQKKRYIYGGKGSRSLWMQRRTPPQ